MKTQNETEAVRTNCRWKVVLGDLVWFASSYDEAIKIKAGLFGATLYQWSMSKTERMAWVEVA
jgi:hypothetical protein